MEINYLLKVLPRALATDQGCAITDIEMPTEAKVGEVLRILIAGRTHQIPYQIALELALDWLAKYTSLFFDGYYPVAHLHRDDIIMQKGHYISSQLSDEDIEALAERLWNDSFAESFWDAHDYILENDHPDLTDAPETLVEQQLDSELCACIMQTQNFDEGFIVSFLKAEVARDISKDSLNDSGTGLMRRFIVAMQSNNVVPDHVDCAVILKRLDYLDYHQNFMSALYAHARREFVDYIPDIQIPKNQIFALLDAFFEAGITVSQALEKLLPQIKADLDEDRATKAKIQAQKEYDNQRNSSISNHQNLCDPISDNLLTVKITGDKDGIHLRFPALDLQSDGVEHIVTLEYRNGELQVLVHNATSQTAAQVIPIANISS